MRSSSPEDDLRQTPFGLRSGRNQRGGGEYKFFENKTKTTQGTIKSTLEGVFELNKSKHFRLVVYKFTQ